MRESHQVIPIIYLTIIRKIIHCNDVPEVYTIVKLLVNDRFCKSERFDCEYIRSCS